jgi:hypothetical protein
MNSSNLSITEWKISPVIAGGINVDSDCIPKHWSRVCCTFVANVDNSTRANEPIPKGLGPSLVEQSERLTPKVLGLNKFNPRIRIYLHREELSPLYEKSPWLLNAGIGIDILSLLIIFKLSYFS